MFILWKT